MRSWNRFGILSFAAAEVGATSIASGRAWAKNPRAECVSELGESASRVASEIGTPVEGNVRSLSPRRCEPGHTAD